MISRTHIDASSLYHLGIILQSPFYRITSNYFRFWIFVYSMSNEHDLAESPATTAEGNTSAAAAVEVAAAEVVVVVAPAAAAAAAAAWAGTAAVAALAAAAAAVVEAVEAGEAEKWRNRQQRHQ